MNLIFSYFDTTVSPPKLLSAEMVHAKDDTIASLLSKVYTGLRQTSLSSHNIGVNPLPLSILSAGFTFLPLVQLRTARNFIPIARFNVPFLNSDGSTSYVKLGEDVDEDSVARVAGYVASGDTYSSLRQEIIRLLKTSTKENPDREYRRIERQNHKKWLGMDSVDSEGVESISSDQDSLRKVRSEASSVDKSTESGGATSSASSNVQMQSGMKPIEDGITKVQLKKEVGAWWGRKCAD